MDWKLHLTPLLGNATELVRNFTERWLAHPILRRYLQDLPREVMLKHQIALVAYALGKPVQPYNAQAMRDAHEPLAISSHAYEEMVSLLRQTLLDAKFDGADIITILATLDRQRHHIVAGAPQGPLYPGIERRRTRRSEG